MYTKYKKNRDSGQVLSLRKRDLAGYLFVIFIRTPLGVGVCASIHLFSM